MKRALLLLPALVLAAGCASSHPKATRASHPPPARVPLRVPTAAENEAAARSDAARLLRSFRLPAGARRTHWLHGRHDSPGFLELSRAWRVPRPPARVKAFLAAHDQRTGRLPGIAGPGSWRWLIVTTKPLPDGSSAVGVAVQEQYVLPLARRDRVPASVSEVELGSALGTAQPPFLSRRVTDRAAVQRIVRWFDLLGRVPPKQGCLLVLRSGPTVTVTFRGADGRVVARAVARDTGPILTGCDGFQLTVGGRTVRVVGGDVLRRIERLVGVRFRPRTVPPALRCPATTPPLQTKPAVGKGELVRPHAIALLLCRYRGLNAPRPSTVARRRLVLDRRTIRSVTRGLDSLRHIPHGIYNCPFDDNSEILLLLAYRSGPSERVTVHLRGCRFATNGRTSRFTTARLRARLLGLLSRGRAGAS